MARRTACPADVQTGRLAKAEQFWSVAEMVETLAGDAGDVGDAYVTLCVHAAIAAADVLCCAALGEHASGENHNEAVALLGRVDKPLSRSLATLLAMKTSAGYSHRATTGSDWTRAGRAASALMSAARETRRG